MNFDLSSSFIFICCLFIHFYLNRNPNEQQKQEQVLPASKERSRFRSITWDQYDPVHQKYLEIGKSSLFLVSMFLTI